MKPFVVIFVLKPAVTIESKINNFDFTFNEFDGAKRVIIMRLEEEINNQIVQTGLLFRVYIQAEDVNVARDRAKGFVDGVIGLITFATNVGLSIPKETLAYELTPNTEEREFLQIFHNPANITISRRKINHEFFVRFKDRIYKQKESTYHYIARALRWYRMGILTFDIFDKFTCFWIGLEALNPVLRSKLGASHESKKMKCPNCGNEWLVSNPTVSGIKCFVKDRLQNPSLYKSLHESRVKLLHSTCELGEIGQEIKELTPKLSETLFRAVCFVLDFEDWINLPYKEILESAPLRMEVEGRLLGDYSGNLGFDGSDPHLVPSHKLVDFKVDKNGLVTFTNTANFQIMIQPFKSFHLSEIRMYGDKETSGEITSIGKTDKNGQYSKVS